MFIRKRNGLVPLVAVAVVVGGGLIALAQIRDAGSKVRGDAYSRSSARSMRHSRDTSRDLRLYAQRSRRTNQPVSPTVARSHVEELASNVKLTQKYLAEEKKEMAGNKAALDSLAKIEKHVNEEAKHVSTLSDLVKGDQIDPEKAIRSCDDAEDHIDKALLEHDELELRVASE